MSAYDPDFVWTGNAVMPFYDSNDPVLRLPSKRSKWHTTRMETFKERKERLARERTLDAILLRKHLSPEALPERQYERDRREGRAVGVDSRYRVMLC